MKDILNLKKLRKAAEDFRYLLNQRYPRQASLELVGNRYQLTFEERHLLHRGVFSNRDSKRRQEKKITIREVRNEPLAIDGHNVLITIEAGLAGRPLILGDDGFLRDISGLSNRYKKTEGTEKAIQIMIDLLKKVKPSRILFLLDAPISMSGKLAQEIRDRMRKENLSGDARAVRVPEKILIGYPGIIATSDTAIIDQSKRVLDLAGDILKRKIPSRTLIRILKKGRDD